MPFSHRNPKPNKPLPKGVRKLIPLIPSQGAFHNIIELSEALTVHSGKMIVINNHEDKADVRKVIEHAINHIPEKDTRRKFLEELNRLLK